MKIYLVGGAVRDRLLGLPVKERDWVVVGATVNDMLNLGYRQVGKEFPVFLHPKTGEEYALARRERKIKPGYQGFDFDTSPEVSLADDLIRRDLTINAMAESETGELIDLYHGEQDLNKKILRHVSPAFTEDPVRILRVGRFLARYAHGGFHVATETMTLMRQMVESGEVNALVSERVWKEWERALGEKNPECFFEALHQCKALSILFPELQDDRDLDELKAAVTLTANTMIRFAVTLPVASAMTSLCHRYRVPTAYRELALLVARYHETAIRAHTLSAVDLLSLMSALDVFRRLSRFENFLVACQAIATARGDVFNPEYLKSCAKAVQSVDVQSLIAQGLSGPELANRIKAKRLEKIEEWMKSG